MSYLKHLYIISRKLSIIYWARTVRYLLQRYLYIYYYNFNG